MTATTLPVAGPARVRAAAIRLLRQDVRGVAATLGLNALASAAGLAAPWLLGRIIDTVRAGGTTAAVDRLAGAIVVCATARLLLSRYAALAGARFGERTLARVRERFAEQTLALPAAVVERAGTGDLTSRGTGDVRAVGIMLRDIGPSVLIAGVQGLLLLAAVVLIQPALGACALLGLTGVWAAVRWYLRRARPAYLEQAAAWAALADEIAACATGARTVDALGLRDRRIAAGERAIGRCRRIMLRTLVLRNVLWGCVETCYALPVAATLLLGGLLHAHGAAGLGDVVACALYFTQLTGPLDTLLVWSDQLQSGSAAFARVEGLAEAPARAPGAGRPDGGLIEVTGVRYGYREGGDVLQGVDLTVRPGERLALVGPSGAGKSTLSRLLAGIEPPGSGTVTVGGVPVAGLDPGVLRRQVVLVTQEHHVFLGTLRDNLAIAAPGADDHALRAALETVGAGWAVALPQGLDTVLGSGGHPTDGSQAQQLALARVVLADPHTVVLDEATALLDPATARHTERALAAVLTGRTVIAVAHRLHTAHDADRVAVMVDGRIAELGSHDELLASGGAYAALWESWHGNRTTPARPTTGQGADVP